MKYWTYGSQKNHNDELMIHLDFLSWIDEETPQRLYKQRFSILAIVKQYHANSSNTFSPQRT